MQTITFQRLKTPTDGINESGENTLLADDEQARPVEHGAQSAPYYPVISHPTVAAKEHRAAAPAEQPLVGRRANLSSAKRALLDKWLRGQGKPSATTIPLLTERVRVPLSFAQQRLWFFSQLDPGTPLYNIPLTLRLQGRLNLGALRLALDALVARHEVLRTHFLDEEGSPLQLIDEARSVSVVEVDLRAEPDATREAKLLKLLAEESQRPFDLTHDLMVRGWVGRLTETEHALMVTMHHIASDQWSSGIFLQELGAFYAGFDAGTPVALPELPIQYADFAAWQRSWLAGEVGEKQLAYWKNKLAGADPVLELPTDRPRPVVQTFRGGWESQVLAGPLSEAVKRLGRQEGATLFMTMLAAFTVWLHRYTRQRDLVVGTPIAGRTQVETEGVVGFFVNTLAIRSNLSGDPTFLQILHQVRETCLEAFSHQDLPFDKLVEELRPERSAGYSPLSQVMFVLRNATLPPTPFPGLVATPMEVSTNTAKFDLTCSVDETAHGLAIGLEYNADLFTRETIQRMLGHFRVLLEGITENPAGRIAELPLLTTKERAQLLAEWNDTRTDFPRDVGLAPLFEQQVEQTPDAVALVFRDEKITYRELNQRANRLARHLRAWGVGPDMPVALCLERSVEMIVALLGILKAGGAYVSLDPDYPKERLAFMLDDLRPPVVLTQEKLRPVLLEASAGSATAGPTDRPCPRFLCLDQPGAVPAAEILADPPSDVTPENLAYISYTSGSTGRPKGVCIPQRAVVRLVKATHYARFGPDEVFLQLAPVAFDASTLEIWGALLNGGRLVISPPGLLSLAELGAVIRQNGITTLWLTAGLFHQMVEEQLDSLKNLRQLLAGGDTLSPSHAQAVLGVLQHGRLINGYGPTESTTFACCHPVAAVSTHRSIPIGRPIANTEVYILDENRQLVPIGVPGELYVGGDGLARGYFNRPELTAEKFVAHPFNPARGARLYRTGDRTRYLANGDIEFLGRIDLQIKIRGFRIELEEVETVLSQEPGVRACAVVAVSGEHDDKRLVAYVTPDRVLAPTAEILRAALREKLPDYMVPSAILFLEELPLNPNGKVDRRALPAPGALFLAPRATYVAPRDELEKKLAAIWESVLGVAPIGINHHFFELGGHSLLAVRLVARIEKTFGRKLSVSAIFQAPSIEQLAALIHAGAKPPAGSAVVAIQPRGTRPPLFLVHGVGGGMFWGYANLARHLGPDQPIYAFQPRDLEGGEEFGTIEEMAAFYIQELRRFLPGGPYQLGGYCFGGIVAYEMARQLERQGERVSLLVLLNCSAPNSGYDHFRWTPLMLARFLRNVCYWFGYFLGWKPADRRRFIRWKLKNAVKRIFAWRPKARDAATIDVNELVDLSDLPENQRKLWSSHTLSLTRYHPQPYDGAVLLVRTRGHQLACSFDPHYGWRELVRNELVVRLTPGAHESLLKERYVHAVARELAPYLGSTRFGEKKSP